MDVDELLKTAWRAVEESGVPEELRETAFKEAIAYLRGREQGDSAGRTGGGDGGTSGHERDASQAEDSSNRQQHDDEVSEDAFFSRLAEESGVDEHELRQVFHVKDGKDGKVVRVNQPARQLGKTKAEQARAVVTLVAGARFGGLDESPVKAEPVRNECDRKKCYDGTNFSKQVRPLAQFHLSGRDSIVVNPRWTEDFDDAVGRLVGRPADDAS